MYVNLHFDSALAQLYQEPSAAKAAMDTVSTFSFVAVEQFFAGNATAQCKGCQAPALKGQPELPGWGGNLHILTPNLPRRAGFTNALFATRSTTPNRSQP